MGEDCWPLPLPFLSASFSGNICAGPSGREEVGVPPEPPKFDPIWELVIGEVNECDLTSLEPDESDDSFKGSCCLTD